MASPDRPARAPSASVSIDRSLWRGGAAETGRRRIPEERAVALVHDATTTAVMMATPADVEDLAVGFALTEGVIGDIAEIRSLEVVETRFGIEARAWLDPATSRALADRRRRSVGPTGCGLCGIESLEAAMRSPRRVGAGLRLTAADIHAAVEGLAAGQVLGAATRSVHAAGWFGPGGAVAAIREDVGRHNALDKTIGALARLGRPAPPGGVVLTSRVSVEMVQKAAAAGAQALIAVSAPTALAVRTAAAAGMTLVAVARADSFEVFADEERPDPVRVAGLILCGGASRRFGAEKALADLAGRPLIAHVADVLGQVCQRLAVNAPASSGAAAWARGRGLEVVADQGGGLAGPLLGVLAGLGWAARAGVEALAIAPCDTPFLPGDLVSRLAETLGQAPGAVAIDSHGAPQPLCALWRVQTIAQLQQALASGRHPSAGGLLAALGFSKAVFGDPDAFLNVNSRQDIGAARAVLARRARRIMDISDHGQL